MAAGFNCFREWYLRLDPLYPIRLYYANCSGDPELKIRAKAWTEEAKQELFKWTSRLLSEKCIEEKKKPLIEEIKKILNSQSISSSAAIEYYYKLFKYIYDNFSKNIYWVKNQAKYLLRGDINPYPLLITMLRPLDTIITTNYDLFTELSIYSLFNMGIDYGIDGEDLTSITPWGKHPFEPYSWSRNFVTLLKLHGSINWLKCPACGHFYNTFFTPAIMQSVKHVLKELDGWLRKEYSFSPCCYLFKSIKTEIPLIPPTLKKSMMVGHLANIWEKAIWEIACATELIFIGYSLSESDKHIRQLIEDAFALRRNGKANSYILNQIRLLKENLSIDIDIDVDTNKLKKDFEKFLMKVPKVTIICGKDKSYKTRTRYEDFFSRLGITLSPVPLYASEYFSEEFLKLNPDDIIY